jgi:crotonobetainyl-CoA:carnitine CoA-transferase CaiB-like acyl-CoA transferase
MRSSEDSNLGRPKDHRREIGNDGAVESDLADQEENAQLRKGERVSVLNGVRVVDFTSAMAGPTCTLLLGDFGADVVKIEPPEGDTARFWGENRFGSSKQFTGLYAAFNRNKRSVVLDLKSEEGQRVIGALLAEADVVIEAFRPGVADRLGIGYDHVASINPGVVYCSLSGFGQTGPLRERAGLDMMMQAFAGHMSVTGEEGRPSIRTGPSPIDLMTGTNAAFGIVLALLEREHSGQGQYLETSLYDTALELMTHFIADFTGSGVPQGKSGPFFAFASPYGIFNARDREFYMGATPQRAYEALCRAIDRGDLIEDPRFATNGDRIKNREALHAELFPIFLTKDAEEWVALCIELNIPASLVSSLAEIVDQPQAIAREMIVETGIDGVKSAGIPIKLARTPGEIRRTPPELGADNDEVVEELRANGRLTSS